MTKNKQIEGEMNVAADKAPQAKGSAFGYKAFIVLLLLSGLGVGGYYWQTISQMQAEIDSLKQSTAENVDNLSKRINKTGQHFQDILYNLGDSVDKNCDDKLARLKKELQNEMTQLMFGAQAGADVKAENGGENTSAETTETSVAAPQTAEKVITIEREKTPQEVLLAAGALIVMDMAENGLPIEYESEVLQILADGNSQAQKYADTAQKYATSGIKGRQMLIKEYNALYAALNEEPEKVQDTQAQEEIVPQKWQDKFWYWLKKAVVQKKKVKKPEFKAETDEVYELVNAGKLREALLKMKTDSKYNAVNSPALAAWQQQVEDYLAFETAMKGLIMNALANIRLKEMER